jgi:hypothetical protein
VRILGEIYIHWLNMSVSYIYEDGIFTLGVNLRIPDHDLRKVAIRLAEYIRRPVVWQDIVGKRYRVHPDGTGNECVSFKDPRSVLHYANKRKKHTRKT